MDNPFAETREAAAALFEEGQVVELRALDVPEDWTDSTFTYSGYFNDREKLAAAAVNLDRKGAKAVYVTLNPVIPDLLARRKNRVERSPRSTTKNEEIQRRRLLLLDFDPVRPAGISSTAEELKAARARAIEVGHFLKDKGWPGGVLAVSGNGAHLLYRVDLPPDDGGLTKRVLEALDERFTGGGVDVDTGVHNAARISKLYGTTARKGDATDARLHRRSKIIRVADPLEVVPTAKLEAIAETAETKGEAPSHSSGAGMGGPEAKPSGSADGRATEEVRKALAHVPPRPDYEDWYRIAAGVYDAVNCDLDTADRLLKEWSDEEKPGEYRRKAPDFDDIGAGTFFRIAKQHGYTPPRKRNGRAKPKPKGHASKNASDDSEKDERTQAQLILDQAADANLSHTGDGQAYATFCDDDGRTRTVRVFSSTFTNHLRRRFFRERGRPPQPAAVKEAKGMLEARAEFDAPERDVHIRTAASGGRIYVDLCNEGYEVVEIGPDGWTLLDAGEAPVLFRRGKGVKPLPRPEKGGSLARLREYVRVETDGEFALLCAWLMQALNPTGDYPLLNFGGEQDTGKTTGARILHSLTDPSHVPVRTLPRGERDLMISAENSRVLAFDNLSGLSLRFSNAFCRLSTGGGYAVRTHYENREEELFWAKRPVILTGIEELATRGDLQSRAVILRLSPIPDGQRIDKKKLLAKFDRERPVILGALFDAMSAAQKERAEREESAGSRMGAFVAGGQAAEHVFGVTEGTFDEAYRRNQRKTDYEAVEGDVVASSIRKMLRDDSRETPGVWEGRMSTLREELLAYLPDPEHSPKDFPKGYRGMTAQLRGVMPSLRAVGIEKTDDLGPKGRTFRLQLSQEPAEPAEKRPSRPLNPSAASPARRKSGGNARSDHSAASAGTPPPQKSGGVEKQPSKPTNGVHSAAPPVPPPGGKAEKPHTNSTSSDTLGEDEWETIPE